MLIECVPNISEARDMHKVLKIADSVKHSGARLLHVDPSPEVNRTVITFAGNKEQVSAGAFELIKTASELIDMRTHTSIHPRIGAVDVCPFIPLDGAGLDDCSIIARQLGKQVAELLKIPAFMYEEAAFCATRRSLPDVRRGELEGLSSRKDLPDFYHADFFSGGYHKTAGAIIIGARKILVAYNITLNKNGTLAAAKKIAAAIRASSGNNQGLPYLRAIGWQHPQTGKVQVSMNLIDHTVTGLWRVYQRIEHEAIARGAGIESSEIIGLVPAAALQRVLADSGNKGAGLEKVLELLKLTGFKLEERVIERVV